jgi:hypothetical protein
MKWKNPFDLDADKDLSDLAWFKLIIGVGVTSIVVTIVLIVWNNSISYGMTYQHFNGVFEVFKFPLQMLIAMTAAIALLAALHKSEQTRKQIYLANVQNNFVNYYKHLEEFKKYVDHLDPEQITAGNSAENYTINYRQLHSLFYKNSVDGDYNCCFTLMDNKILKGLEGLSKDMDSISSRGVESYFDTEIIELSVEFDLILSKICDIGKQLMLPKNFNDLVKFKFPGSMTLNIENSIILMKIMITILFHINFVSSFDRKHIPYINYISDMDTKHTAKLLQLIVNGQNLPDYIMEFISSLMKFHNYVVKLETSLE